MPVMTPSNVVAIAPDARPEGRVGSRRPVPEGRPRGVRGAVPASRRAGCTVWRAAWSATRLTARNLLQEIFLQAHRKLAGFKGESTLATWLYRLAMNICLDHLRSKSARMRQATDSFDADEGPEPPVAPDETALVVNRIDLERAVARLPEGCRAAFLLHDVEGLEHLEVAAILNIAEARRNRRCTRRGGVSARSCAPRADAG